MSEKPGFDFVIKNTTRDDVVKYLELAKRLIADETTDKRYSLTLVVNRLEREKTGRTIDNT